MGSRLGLGHGAWLQEVLGQGMAKFWKEMSDVTCILWDARSELKEAVRMAPQCLEQ